MTKKVAIVQSNYIPWKGYFDLIASVDEFIIYDDMQFTKNDWRNRNKIKTPQGLNWLTVPVGQDIRRRIRDVVLPDSDWQARHWKILHANYARASHYEAMAEWIAPLYLEKKYKTLSELNRAMIEAICMQLHIETRITNSWDYHLPEGKTERLVDLCRQCGATDYISGPAAKDYIDANQFASNGIGLHWFGYDGYPVYSQQWGEFQHGVTVLDLFFNCGRSAIDFMKAVNRR